MLEKAKNIVADIKADVDRKKRKKNCLETREWSIPRTTKARNLI